MSDFNRAPAASGAADMAMDAGLRGFMLGVYNKLALGLILSAGLAFLTSSFAPARDLLYVVDGAGRFRGMTILGLVIQFAPLAIMLLSSFIMRNPSPVMSGVLYWTIVSTMGASLGVWLLLYTGASAFMTLLITATFSSPAFTLLRRLLAPLIALPHAAAAMHWWHTAFFVFRFVS